MLKAIRCGRGLGDSIYLQSVVRYLTIEAPAPQRLKVRSDWPDVFRPLGDRVVVTPFNRTVDILAHYAARKHQTATTQFQDCLSSAGIKAPVPLRIDWVPTRDDLIRSIQARGKPVLLVALPRTPMGRTDGFGAELLPDCEVIQRVIDELGSAFTVVQVGAGAPLFRYRGIDVDLANAATVADLFDVASIADRFLGYCSYLVPLAESFGRPALFVWSRAGVESRQMYVRQITPEKVLQHPATSRAVFDDATDEQLAEALDDFLR